MSTQLIVVDEYYSVLAKFFKDQCDQLNYAILDYTYVLDDVIESGIKQGETTKALKEFKRQVENHASKKSANPELLGKEAFRYAENFVISIDKADGDLY